MSELQGFISAQQPYQSLVRTNMGVNIFFGSYENLSSSKKNYHTLTWDSKYFRQPTSSGEYYGSLIKVL